MSQLCAEVLGTKSDKMSTKVLAKLLPSTTIVKLPLTVHQTKRDIASIVVGIGGVSRATLAKIFDLER